MHLLILIRYFIKSQNRTELDLILKVVGQAVLIKQMIYWRITNERTKSSSRDLITLFYLFTFFKINRKILINETDNFAVHLRGNKSTDSFRGFAIQPISYKGPNEGRRLVPKKFRTWKSALFLLCKLLSLIITFTKFRRK